MFANAGTSFISMCLLCVVRQCMLPSYCNAKRTLFWVSRKESGVLRYSQICAVPKICLGVYIIISMLQLDSIVIKKKNKQIHLAVASAMS